MSMFLSVPEARAAIESAGRGRLFSVLFSPRGSPGTERRMLAMLGVRKWLRGNARDSLAASTKAIENDFLIVADMQKLAYRSVPLESVLEVRVRGQRIRPGGAPLLATRSAVAR